MKDQLIARLRGTNYAVLNIDDREASDVLSRAELEFVMRRFTADSNVKKKGFEIDSKRRLDLSNLLTSHITFKRIKTSGDGDFMIGTEDNGALRTPDKDYQLLYSGGATPYSATDNFGVFVRIPNECLFITSESCSTTRDSSIKNNVPVKVVSYEDYITKIYHPYESPGYNLVWRMDSGNWTPAAELSPSTEESVKNLTGDNADASGNPITIATERSVHLIPGKDWVVSKYTIHYVKKPRRILVDTISPNLQQSSELNSSVHDEIVDVAVRLFTADRIPEQAKYQVAEKEQREDE